MAHETIVHDRDVLAALTPTLAIELAESTEKVEDLYDTAVNGADQVVTADTGGWPHISIIGWCHEATPLNRNTCLYLVEYSDDNAHWYEYYRSVGVETGVMRWDIQGGNRRWRITAGDLLGAGTGNAGDLIDLIIASKM